VLAPHGKATGFLAVNTVVHGISASTAPILGGILADRLTGQHLPLIVDWLSTNVGASFAASISGLFGIHTLFLITGIIGFYAMRRLRAVHEENEVEGRVVVAHLVAQAGNAVRHVPDLSEGSS